MKSFLISFLFIAFFIGSFSSQEVINSATASSSSKDSHKGHDHGEHKPHKGHVDDDEHERHDHGEHKPHKGHVDDDEHEGHDHGEHKPHKGHVDGDEHEGHDHGEHKTHKGHGHHGGGKSIGKGKAIEAVDEAKGFKLSSEAIKTLKLKLKTVDGDTFTVSKNTLVTSKSLKGVYRYRGGFFKLLKADIIKESPSGYKVKVSGVDFGDQIVINGTGLLRTTDVYSTDKSEYGHSH